MLKKRILSEKSDRHPLSKIIWACLWLAALITAPINISHGGSLVSTNQAVACNTPACQ